MQFHLTNEEGNLEKKVAIPQELKPHLFEYFEYTFLDDEYNRNFLEHTGKFHPHPELFSDYIESRLESEREEETLIEMCDALPFDYWSAVPVEN